jgi:hypothetical protein
LWPCDADSLAVAAEATLGGLGFPLDMALDTANSRLYVAHELAPKYGAVSLIDTADMSVQLTRWGDLSEPSSVPIPSPWTIVRGSSIWAWRTACYSSIPPRWTPKAAKLCPFGK